MKNAEFRVVPLPEDIARTLREQRRDDAGNPLTPRTDASRHQCRSCLRLTNPWEPYLAVSYAPMSGTLAFAERGPIYIHERPCEWYAKAAEYPEEFPREAVVLRSYGATEEIEGARYVGARPVEEVIGELFANPQVRYVHARNATYGCFMFKLERDESSTGAGA
jgi:hypothetical protein